MAKSSRITNFILPMAIENKHITIEKCKKTRFRPIISEGQNSQILNKPKMKWIAWRRGRRWGRKYQWNQPQKPPPYYKNPTPIHSTHLPPNSHFCLCIFIHFPFSSLFTVNLQPCLPTAENTPVQFSVYSLYFDLCIPAVVGSVWFLLMDLG